jgi:uncharacterized protein YjbJ (UPF0337 family)
MNEHQSRGQSKQIKGGARELAGKAAGSRKLEVKGKIQKAAGRIQERVGDAKARRDARKPH